MNAPARIFHILDVRLVYDWASFRLIFVLFWANSIIKYDYLVIKYNFRLYINTKIIRFLLFKNMFRVIILHFNVDCTNCTVSISEIYGIFYWIIKKKKSRVTRRVLKNSREIPRAKYFFIFYFQHLFANNYNLLTIM